MLKGVEWGGGLSDRWGGVGIGCENQWCGEWGCMERGRGESGRAGG